MRSSTWATTPDAHEDCCADRDAEVHRAVTAKVFARQATVVKAEQVVKAFAAA
jgi:hypothetical protein